MIGIQLKLPFDIFFFTVDQDFQNELKTYFNSNEIKDQINHLQFIGDNISTKTICVMIISL